MPWASIWAFWMIVTGSAASISVRLMREPVTLTRSRVLASVAPCSWAIAGAAMAINRPAHNRFKRGFRSARMFALSPGEGGWLKVMYAARSVEAPPCPTPGKALEAMHLSAAAPLLRTTGVPRDLAHVLARFLQIANSGSRQLQPGACAGGSGHARDGPRVRGGRAARRPRRQQAARCRRQWKVYSTVRLNERPRGSATRGSQAAPEAKSTWWAVNGGSVLSRLRTVKAIRACSIPVQARL